VRPRGFRLLPLALAVAAACAAPAPAPSPAPAASLDGPFPSAPVFAADGTVLRDVATGAPVHRVVPGKAPHLPPRFNPDGTVARDPATGAPLREEKGAGGRVVRVLVVLP